MTYLVAVSILTGPPQSLSVDTTRLTDDSLITDWQTYFFAADTTITQYQSISVTAILSGQPIVSTTGLIQAYSFQANDLVTNQPTLSDTTLTENYPLQANNIVSLQPVVSVAPITEDENFLADNIISGVPEVNPASISQNNSFDAINILTGRPDVEDATDPNVIYEEVTQRMFGGWPKRLYEHTDLAISRGHSTGYRTLYKFGYNPDVNGAEETVWGQGGNYPWFAGELTVFVSSSSANDSGTGTGARTILIQGLDENYAEVEETITLNGQAQITSQLSYLRIYRAYVTLAGSGGSAAGTIYIGSSGATGGVPNTSIYASLSLGNQTQIAAYTVPAGHTLYVDEINFTAAVSQANKLVTCKFVSREFGSNVFRTRFIQVLQSNQLIQTFKYPQAFAEKTDLECRASTDTTNTALGASFQGVLIKNET